MSAKDIRAERGQFFHNFKNSRLIIHCYFFELCLQYRRLQEVTFYNFLSLSLMLADFSFEKDKLERNEKADFLFTQFRNYSTYSTRLSSLSLSLSFVQLKKLQKSIPLFLDKEKKECNEMKYHKMSKTV